MTVELVGQVDILLARRFHSMDDADSGSLLPVSYVRMQHFVRRSTYYVPVRRCVGGMRCVTVFSSIYFAINVALLGTLGTFRRDALQEGSANIVA
jgi:hypothetical protein